MKAGTCAFILLAAVAMSAAVTEEDMPGAVGTADPFTDAMSAKLERAKKLHTHMLFHGVSGTKDGGKFAKEHMATKVEKLSATSGMKAKMKVSHLKAKVAGKVAKHLMGKAQAKAKHKVNKAKRTAGRIQRKMDRKLEKGDKHLRKTQKAADKVSAKAVKHAAKIVQSAKKTAAAMKKNAAAQAAATAKKAGKAKKIAKQATAAGAVEKVQAHKLVAKARRVEAQAEKDGRVAREAAASALKSKQLALKHAAAAKKHLKSAHIAKVFARAKAAEQSEVAQKKVVSATKYKQQAKTMLNKSKVTNRALKREIVKEKALSNADKAMAAKLKKTQAKAKLDRQRARKELRKADKAKMKIKLAARKAIHKAVKNAAVLANIQKAKVMKAQAKESASKNIGSANTLAAQAKTAAEERLAKKEVRKARRQMVRVRVEKNQALKKIKRTVKKDANKYAAHSRYAKTAKLEKTALKKEEHKAHKLKTLLKKASSTGTTSTTLLTRMYRPVPYENVCGHLSKDPMRLRQTSAKTVGACAAKCAAVGNCKSFQHTGGLCTLSKKKIIRPSKYGEMLACATKNVLITASMKLSTQPQVFEKKAISMGESDNVSSKQTVSTKAKGKYGFSSGGSKEASVVKNAIKKDVKADKKAVGTHISKGKTPSVARIMRKAKHDKKKKAAKKMIKKAKKSAKKAKKSANVSKASHHVSKASHHVSKASHHVSKTSCSAMLKRAKASLGTCRRGIRTITDKSIAAQRHLVATSRSLLRKRLGQLKSADHEILSDKLTAEKDGVDSKLKKAMKAKYTAKLALKKALSYTKAEKRKLKYAEKLASKVGKYKAGELKVENQLKAKRLKDSAAKARLKKKANGLKVALMKNKAGDALKIAKDRKRVSALEKAKIAAKASGMMLKSECEDLRTERKQVILSSRHMAMGLNMKILALKNEKKRFAKQVGVTKKWKKKHAKLMKKVKKGVNALGQCEKSKYAALLAAKKKYGLGIKGLSKKIALANTQSQLAKRGLQLCEKKSAGATARAANRVRKRTNRAVRRAKKKMNKKKKAKKAKALMKVKVKAKMKKKMKKKFAKKVAKKAKKLTKKKIAPKCKACMKLTKEEHKLLGADCKACEEFF